MFGILQINISLNDINILSLPYIKSNLISTGKIGTFYNSVALSLVKGNCADSNFAFPISTTNSYFSTPKTTNNNNYYFTTSTNSIVTTASTFDNTLNLELAGNQFSYFFVVFFEN